MMAAVTTIAMWLLILESFEASGKTIIAFHAAEYKDLCKKHNLYYYSYSSLSKYLKDARKERARAKQQSVSQERTSEIASAKTQNLPLTLAPAQDLSSLRAKARDRAMAHSQACMRQAFASASVQTASPASVSATAPAQESTQNQSQTAANKLVTISNPQNNAAVNRLLQGVFDHVPNKPGTRSFVDEFGPVKIERGRMPQQATAGTTRHQNTLGNEPDATPRADSVPSVEASTTTEQPLTTKQGAEPSNDGIPLAPGIVLAPDKVINCISPVLGVGGASSTPPTQQQRKVRSRRARPKQGKAGLMTRVRTLGKEWLRKLAGRASKTAESCSVFFATLAAQ